MVHISKVLIKRYGIRRIDLDPHLIFVGHLEILVLDKHESIRPLASHILELRIRTKRIRCIFEKRISVFYEIV